MMQVTKSVEFDAAHRVPMHDSKCKHVHGHRYKVAVTVEGPVVPDDEQRPDAGMVLDFGDIKAALMTHVHDIYDHRTIVWHKDELLLAALELGGFESSVVRVPFVPTAERLAQHIATVMGIVLRGPYRVVSCTVWETPTSEAVWIATQ